MLKLEMEYPLSQISWLSVSIQGRKSHLYHRWEPRQAPIPKIGRTYKFVGVIGVWRGIFAQESLFFGLLFVFEANLFFLNAVALC